jgi:hypothetical protein
MKTDHFKASELKTATKGMTAVHSTGSLLVPSLAKLSASFPSILQYPDIHTEVTLLDPLIFSSAYIHSPTTANSAVVLASAAIDALLAEQMCVLLFITFLHKRSSVHVRFAITSSRSIVRGYQYKYFPHGYPLV